MSTQLIKAVIVSRYTPVCERFWSRVDKQSDSGCWNWTAHTNEKGYGRLLVNEHHTFAHRFSYESIVGKIPDGLTLDHKCLNKRCVNPAHLEVVTGGENARRFMLARPTCRRGHEWTKGNTRTDIKGRRCCRACARIHWKIKQEKKHANN